jgi:hypothetical protein
LDGYVPGRSDVDLMAVVAAAPPRDTLAAVAAALDHRALPCPATGLEFVLYPRATVAAAGTGAGYLLDLNTGRELPPKVSVEPGDGPAFWYVIDRDVTRQADRSLSGPPPSALFARVPRAALLPVVVASLEAHAGAGHLPDNAVLNACRALRWATQGRWYAKPVAGRWARGELPRFAGLLDAALAAHAADRTAGASLPPAEVAALLTAVGDRLRTVSP